MYGILVTNLTFGIWRSKVISRCVLLCMFNHEAKMHEIPMANLTFASSFSLSTSNITPEFQGKRKSKTEIKMR